MTDMHFKIKIPLKMKFQDDMKYISLYPEQVYSCELWFVNFKLHKSNVITSDKNFEKSIN